MRRTHFNLSANSIVFLIIILLLMTAAAGCNGDDDNENEGEVGAVSTNTAEQLPDEAQNYIELSRQALASQLGVEADAVVLESITEPAAADEAYIIVLTHEGQRYEYHGRNNEVMLVSDPLPTAPTATEAATPITGTITNTAMIEAVMANVDTEAEMPLELVIIGNFRNGCEEIDEKSAEIDEGNTFVVTLTTMAPLGVACTEALVPFEETVTFTADQLADLPSGEYTIVINGENYSTFTWPGDEATEVDIQPVVELALTDAVAADSETKIVPAVDFTEGAPFWEIHPTYTVISLTDYSYADSAQEARIYIYPTSALAEVNETASAEIETLFGLLDDRPDLTTVVSLPLLPLTGENQVLVAQTEYVDFSNGSGIRYLTQQGPQDSAVNNQELFYTFQGLTENNVYYIAAVLPVSHPDLPASSEDAPEDFADDYDSYLVDLMEQLDAAEAADFSPGLSELDEFIMSLSVVSSEDSETPPEGEETAVHDESDLVFMLEDAGAEVALSTEPVEAADILSVSGNIIFVNGEELQVYQYEDVESAIADAERIAPDGSEIAATTEDGEPTLLDLDGPPHFYIWDNLIILYAGDNSDLLTLLSQVLGEPFASGG